MVGAGGGGAPPPPRRPAALSGGGGWGPAPRGARAGLGAPRPRRPPPPPPRPPWGPKTRADGVGDLPGQPGTDLEPLIGQRDGGIEQFSPFGERDLQ